MKIKDADIIEFNNSSFFITLFFLAVMSLGLILDLKTGLLYDGKVNIFFVCGV